MKTILKKSLAMAVCVALCLTAFIGCVTVSASGTATAVISTATVTSGTTSTSLTVTISGSPNIVGARFDIVADATKATLGTPTVTTGASVEVSTPATDTTRFVVVADDVSTGLASIVVTLPYTDVTATAGTYDVEFGSLLEVAEVGETLMAVTPTDGSITVEAAHVHDFSGAWQTSSTQHWKVCPNDQAIGNQADHDFGDWTTDTAASCTATGTKHRTCATCGYVENGTIPANGHTPAAAVQENVVPATCAVAGSYDSVVYCSVCDAEISRETVNVPATGIHTAAEAVQENVVPATCGAAGSYDSVVYCSVCNAEISRETVNVPATGAHTAAEAVQENVVPATCGAAGSYDSVVYCSVCNAEISRETVNVPATGEHTWGDWVITAEGHSRTCSVCSTVDSAAHDGDPCSVCGYTAVPAHVHSYTSTVTTRPTLTETGVRTYTCTGCDDSYTETIPVATLKTNSDGDKFKVGNNLDLKSSIEIGFRVREAFITEATVVDYYAIFTKNTYSPSGEITGTVTQVKDADAFTTPFDATNRRNVNCNFIASTEMGTTVTGVIYRELSDGSFEAVTKDYSVVTYADNQLGNNATFDTLIIDMLNYGAAAQTNFGYNTANLVTSVSSKYSAYSSAASSSVATVAGDSVSAQDNGVAAGANYAINMTRQLTLDSSIDLFFGLRNADKSAYSGTTELVARFTYTDFNSVEREVEIPYSQFKNNNGAIGPQFNQLTTRDLYTKVTVGIYNGETLVSNVIDYSIASYYVAVCINSPGSYTANLRTLITNMTKYCESAISYFG